jgi:hypothetical protein
MARKTAAARRSEHGVAEILSLSVTTTVRDADVSSRLSGSRRRPGPPPSSAGVEHQNVT